MEIRARIERVDVACDWWIETGTGDGFQTSPTDLTGSRRGYHGTGDRWVAGRADRTFHYDDVVFSRYYAA